MISSLSIYKLPLIKTNFLENIAPLLESISYEYDEVLSNLPFKTNGIQKIDEEVVCYHKIKSLLLKYDNLMARMISRIFFSLLLDISSGICLFFLLITIYRFQILKKRIVEMQLINIKINYHQDLLKKNIDVSSLYVAKIHELIFEEFKMLLLCVPIFFLTIVIMIIFPWRFYQHFLKKTEKKQEMTIQQVFRILGKGLLDVIGLLVMIFVLMSFWRWNYLFWAMSKIKKGEKVVIINKSDEFYEGTSKKQMKLMIKLIFIEILKDFMFFLPFIILMVLAIYPIFIYYSYLKENLNVHRHEFDAHRKTAQYCCLLVLLHLIILIFGIIIFLTLVRISFFFKLFELSKKKRLIKNANIPNYKRNYYEAHIDFMNSELVSICFVLYDVFTLFGFVLVLISFYKIKEWKEKRYYLTIEHNSSENLEKDTIFEQVKNQLILDLAEQIFLDFICLLIFLLLSIFIVWRLPTFYYIVTTDSFEKEVIQSMTFSKKPLESQSKINKLQAEMAFCLKMIIHDFPYIPIFLISFLLMPWRFFSVAFNSEGIYQYDIELTLEDQIKEFRENLINKVFKQGFIDYIIFLEFLAIVITVIRVPFLYMLLQKNLRKEKGISLRKCLQITFLEMIKDLPYVFLSITILIIAPWRVYVIIRIIMSQKERIPSYDDNKKNIIIVSKRKDIWELFLKVITYDYINIVMISLLLISIYKMKVAIKIIRIVWENSFEDNPKYKNYDIRKKLTSHVLLLFEDSKSFFYILIIFLLFLRVQSCYSRLFFFSFSCY